MSDGDAIAAVTGEELLPPRTNRRPRRRHLAALGVTLGLAACGGGGGGGRFRRPPAPPAARRDLPTRQQAARFLGQATMGSSKANVDAVAAQGYRRLARRAIRHAARDHATGTGWSRPATRPPPTQNNQQGFDPVMWRQLIARRTSSASGSAWPCSISSWSGSTA